MEKKDRYRFRSASKIKRRSEISGLFKTGKKWSCTECSIYHTGNENNRNRCAVVVPKECGNAVRRNKIKRSVRELFRNCIKNSSLHLDILVKIHPAIEVRKGKHQLEEALYLWLETVKK